MKVTVGISNRHVHLTKEDLEILFGLNYELTKVRDVNQPGQFASNEFVTIKTDKNKMENVRVLGPVRPYTQAEISKTDSYFLGLKPPVRTSGDVEGSEIVTLIGPKGEVTKACCIIADRHIHIRTCDLEKYNLKNGQKVMVKIGGEKGGILDNVYIKATEKAYYELHLDTDDANAFLLKNNDELEIID